jgi:putative transposase
VERFFGTLKQKLDLWSVADIAQLDLALSQFGYWYNAVRSHQHLHGRTPDEAWFGVDPYLQTPKRIDWFAEWEGLLKGYRFRW